MHRPQAFKIGCLVLMLSIGAVSTVRAAAPAPGGISSELDRASTTTPAEKRAFGEQALREIADAVKIVEKMREAAEREEGSTETLRCLGTKLASMKVLAVVARESNDRMLSALTNSEIASSELEFRRIAIASGKTTELLGEAYTCSGEEAQQGGGTLDVTEPGVFEDNIGNLDEDGLDQTVDVPGPPGDETPTN